jgi:membrane dipeptidase
MNKDAARELHEGSIVIDAVCPLVMNDAGYIAWYRDGGATAIAPTVGGWESARVTLDRIASWRRLLEMRDDLVLVQQAADVRLAKERQRLGIFLHLQGADPIEGNLDLVSLYKSLGVGVIQLTYNVRNRVGDGCEEPSDAGLSRFGKALITRLNEARIILDCSHTGLRTSMEAIELSTRPVILSHSNSAAIHASPRNVPDELIDAIGRSGGVVGIAGFPAMVAATTAPSLDDFVAHIDAVVARIGIDHVGLGIDYYWGQAGVVNDEIALQSYNEAVRAGRWSNAYPPPPHHYPRGIETPRTLSNLTLRLLERGYRSEDVAKILGGNWLRVMQFVWG